MDCCLLDWGKISPAIFGSLFQRVMDAKARHNLSARKERLKLPLRHKFFPNLAEIGSIKAHQGARDN